MPRLEVKQMEAENGEVSERERKRQRERRGKKDRKRKTRVGEAINNKVI